MIKLFGVIDSNIIGINLWFVPQISEHWPKNNPGRLIKKLAWFNRPGTASAFTHKEGIVHEWITSVAVIRIRIWVLNGKTIRLSTSNKRKVLMGEFSLRGIM